MATKFRTDAPSALIVDLALMFGADPCAAKAAVLADAVQSAGWHDDRVMCLCLGVPLDPIPPNGLGEVARQSWRSKRDASIEFVQTQADLYSGSGRLDWACGVLAVVLFRDWAPAMRLTSYRESLSESGNRTMTSWISTRCPWPFVRARLRQVDSELQDELARRSNEQIVAMRDRVRVEPPDEFTERFHEADGSIVDVDTMPGVSHHTIRRVPFDPRGAT